MLGQQQREPVTRNALSSFSQLSLRTDKYLNLGAPLLAGVTVVALSSLAPMALPLGMRGLALTEAISLYGGLALFGGFVLYESVFNIPRPKLRLIIILDPQYTENSKTWSRR